MKSLLAAALVVVSAQAQAQFVVEGNTVRDTLTDLSWLNLDRTENVSFLRITRTGVPGFRRATAGEITDLFLNAGFSIDQPSGDMNDPVRLASVASFTNAFNGRQTNDGGEQFVGFMPDPPWWSPTTLLSGGVSVAPGTVGIAFLDGGGLYATDRGYPGVSSWLVSEEFLPPPSPAPEPATWGLMLAGLALVVARRYRNPRPPSPSCAESSP